MMRAARSLNQPSNLAGDAQITAAALRLISDRYTADDYRIGFH